MAAPTYEFSDDFDAEQFFYDKYADADYDEYYDADNY